MDDDDHLNDEAPARRRRISPWLIVALVGAILAGILLASTVWDNRWSGGDNTAENSVAADKPADMEKWCGAQATYDAMKRELFRRAAQVRGSDDQAYARLSDFALLRVSGPVARGIDDQLKSVTCSGTAALELPPGVQVAGGRRSLSGDIDYIIQPAADGTGNVVRLGNADSIVVPLATLQRLPSAQPAPQQAEPANEAATEENADEKDTTQAPQPQQPPQEVQANPSFDCGAARTRGEIAVCNDPGLAALDRRMAGEFNAAMSQADGSQKRLLQRTRARFLSYRDRCGTSACIAETYRGRIREIQDIMAGRWRG